MDNPGEIKIRTLPRSNETADKKKDTPEKPSAPKPPQRWIIYVGTSAILLAALGLMLSPIKLKLHAKAKAPISGQTDLASINAKANDSVSRYLQDEEIQHDMMVRTREMENIPFKNALNRDNEDDITSMPDTHGYGVQMDSDDSAERIYGDLNDDLPQYADALPVDRINARLANNKWMNEMERAERIAYIGGFIRTAYERGYEVEIDQNLMVVGVKKLNRNKTLNINQVIERLAKDQ